uniref:PPIase cyclophilin-type domain-containing protein n=1 Tax=Schistocephalus solidus TaxID=70667 RepID=A0A183TE67_SCHSO
LDYEHRMEYIVRRKTGRRWRTNAFSSPTIQLLQVIYSIESLIFHVVYHFNLSRHLTAPGKESNILPFVKKYGLNPVTGKKMKAGELIKLNFAKNADGKFHCPVTFKVFNQNTHIVAVRTTGNVYSYEAVERLNIKANNYSDLLTSEPFTKEDIITIQDPTQLEKFNISAFYHVRNNMLEKADANATVIRSANQETKETLAELAKTKLEIPDYMYSNKPKVDPNAKARDAFNTAHYSTGKAAASLTSTVMEPNVLLEPAVLEDDVVRYRYVKSKGYARLVTTHGNLNLELHCELTPKTCENFIRLCESGYFVDCIFHRVIRHFIIQSGDPTGTGLGGDSCWGGAFADEFQPQLKHDSRGVLSMANSGPNSNKSQLQVLKAMQSVEQKAYRFRKVSSFPITIGSLRVVGGLETLDKVEFVETDKDDRPLEEIKILACQVFVNPYKEVDEMLARERKEAKEKETLAQKTQVIPKPGNRREEEAMEATKRAKKRGLSGRPHFKSVIVTF